MGMAIEVLQFSTLYDFNLECLIMKDFSFSYEWSQDNKYIFLNS